MNKKRKVEPWGCTGGGGVGALRGVVGIRKNEKTPHGRAQHGLKILQGNPRKSWREKMQKEITTRETKNSTPLKSQKSRPPQRSPE